MGGPKAGHADEFFQRLTQIGGTPVTWQIYPHAAGDGKALHVIEAESLREILDHLRHFADIYDHTEILEIQKAPAR